MRQGSSRWQSPPVPSLRGSPPSGASACRWFAYWPGCCWRPLTASRAATRSGAATHPAWSTSSATPSSRWTGSPPSATPSSPRSTPITAVRRAPTPRWRRSRTATPRLAADAGLDPIRGPGLVVTLTDAQRDANGRFPRDASPDDLVVHQQDIQAVLNALWSGGAEGIQMQDQRIIGTSAPRCVGNTLLLNGRTYSPPYIITAVGDPVAMQASLAAAPLVTLYKQYVVRFGLGYSEEPRATVDLVGHTEPVRMRFAKPGRAHRLLRACQRHIRGFSDVFRGSASHAG